MNLNGYTPEQIKAMKQASVLWIRSNTAEVSRCVLTMRSVKEVDLFEKSLTKKRIERKIIKDMETNNIPTLFSHTIKDMIFVAAKQVADNPEIE